MRRHRLVVVEEVRLCGRMVVVVVVLVVAHLVRRHPMHADLA